MGVVVTKTLANVHQDSQENVVSVEHVNMNNTSCHIGKRTVK